MARTGTAVPLMTSENSHGCHQKTAVDCRWPGERRGCCGSQVPLVTSQNRQQCQQKTAVHCRWPSAHEDVVTRYRHAHLIQKMKNYYTRYYRGFLLCLFVS